MSLYLSQQVKYMIFYTLIRILHLQRDHAAPRWLDTCSSIGRALTGIAGSRGHGFESRSGLKFFHNCLSCVYNFDDQSCLYIFLHS